MMIAFHRREFLILAVAAIIACQPLPAAEAPAAGPAASPVANATTVPLGQQWSVVSTGQASTLSQVIWTGQQFVAVGGNTVLTSPDGLSWKEFSVGPTLHLNGVATNGTMFTVVGDNSAIFTTHDFTTWTSQVLRLTAGNAANVKLNCVFWTGSAFVALGDSGNVATMDGPASWVVQSNNAGLIFYHAATNGAVFTAATGQGIVLSPDGRTWDVANLKSPGRAIDVASDGHQFVGVSDYNDTVLTSPDGLAWTIRKSSVSAPLRAITWTGTEYVAVGSGSTILTSPDGVTWTKNSADTPSALNGVAGNGRRSVAVGDGGAIFASGIAPQTQYKSASLAVLSPAVSPGPAVTGDPLAQWVVTSSGATPRYWAVAWVGNGFVAAGDNNTLLTSPDGMTWSTHVVPTTSDFYGVRGNGTVAVAVGGNGAIATSTDLVNWVTRNSGVHNRLFDVVWTGSQFVAMGDAATVVTSPDGATWSRLPASGGFSVHHGLWDGHQFVMSEGKNIVNSPDGVHWRASLALTGPQKTFDVATNGNIYVAVGLAAGRVYSSPDGLTWTIRPTGAEVGLSGIVWTGDQFIAVGEGMVLNSPDGINWHSRANDAKVTVLRAVAHHSGTTVMVNDGGYILTNTHLSPAATPEITLAPGPPDSTPKISLTTAETGAKIYFTEDGSVPTVTSSLYTVPFSPTHSGLVKARAFKDGLAPSEAAVARFTIDGVTP